MSVGNLRSYQIDDSITVKVLYNGQMSSFVCSAHVAPQHFTDPYFDIPVHTYKLSIVSSIILWTKRNPKGKIEELDKQVKKLLTKVQ